MKHGSGYIKNCLLGLLIILAACSRDDVAEEGDGYAPLRIGNIRFTGVSTRSATELSGGDIGVFRLASTGYAGTRSNVQYSNSESGWDVASGVTPVYLTRSEAELCAYYPYNSDYSDGVMTLTSQLYASDRDLCYQTGVTAVSGTPVSFTLKHAYAKVTLNLIRDAAYSGTCAVSGISIANAGILTSNTMDMTTGTYGSGTAGTVTVDPGISSIASGSSETVTVLMVPAVSTLSGNITFSFTVDGKTMTTTVDASTAGLSSLTAGKNYTLNVTVRSSIPIVTGETANCYMIVPGEALTIPVNVKGNGGDVAGTGLDVNHTAYSMGIVWESSTGLISLSGFSSSAQTVTVKTNDASATGNAVIAAYDSDGSTILWSWHIWVTNYDPDTPSNGTTYDVTNGGSYTYTFMDRNLGATTVTPATTTTIGLHYQWGRKDPFTASTSVSSNSEATVYDGSGSSFTLQSKEQTVSVSNNLSNSIENPEVFYKGVNNSATGYDWYTSTNDHSCQNEALWGGASTTTPSDKTIFDPCPPGWRVPAWSGGYSPWSALGSNGTTTSTVGTFADYGVTWTAITAGYWPAAGYRHCGNGVLYDAGSNGNYWPASPHSSYGYNLRFYSSYVYPSNNNHRAYGFPVRCVRE
ncbi:MAG: fimbrillin family protein [Mangrovibacterium sp.]